MIERWGFTFRWHGKELFTITFWRQGEIDNQETVSAATTSTQRTRVGFRGKVTA